MVLKKSVLSCVAVGAAMLAVQACGEGGDRTSLTTTGGLQSPTTGGLIASTGGGLMTGGVLGSGGTAETGGRPSSGGVLASGGLAGTGGEMSATGGVGSASGGEVNGTGGVVNGTGGVVTGTGGVVNGTGGATPNEPDKSAGCGNPTPGTSGTFTMDVDGTEREYIVKVPADYDASRPYKLVYAWHYLGGTADRIANGFGGGFYGLEGRSNGSAIFVAGQGLSSGGNTGWPNTGGRDVAFAKAMHAWMTENYCVNETQVFSTGMSYGGIMSNTVGCAMGDVFRAIAPIAGSGPRSFGGSSCTGQVAAWITHGNQDTVVSYASGQASRDHWRSANHCQTTSTSVSPAPCVAYDGCDEGFAVHWCEWSGGHTTPTFAADAIWEFFSQF